jgi:hypothetical protein
MSKNDKPKNNNGLIDLFKKSLLSVSKSLSKNPQDIKRDEYVEESIKLNIIRLNKTEIQNLGGFKNARDLFFPKEKVIEDKTLEKQHIIDKFIQFMKIFNLVPNQFEFESYAAISSNTFKKYFKNIQTLFDYVSINSDITSLVFNEKSFTEDYYLELQNKICNHEKFIVTTAVSGKMVNERFYKSLKNYADRNNALILVLPCSDIANRKSEFEWELDPVLRNCGVVFRDIYLNENIYLDTIKIGAKMVEPLRGLDRFVQQNGSFICASPKQYLRFVPNSNSRIPRASMTTGAITVSDYSNDAYMSKRISKIGEFDHVCGAVIIEIQDSKAFHFRQIQADDDGDIIDLGTMYKPDGTIKKIEGTTIVFGDSHVGVHDVQIHEKLKEIVKEVNCSDIILHDIFNATSITHHDIGRCAIRAAKARDGFSSLEKEISAVRDYLIDVSSWINGKTIIVKSNHDEALDKYLDQGRFINDPENFYFSLDLVKKLIEGSDPLKFIINKQLHPTITPKIKWLERDEDCRIYGVECGSHGDVGINGARGSLVSLEKGFYKCCVGHSHSAGIFRQVYQVGTSSHLKLDYNKGLSTWTHSCCLIYPNGGRQLINIIRHKNGEINWKF